MVSAPGINSQKTDIVQMEHTVGFTDIDEDGVNELINFENKDLTNIKDLIALEEKANIQVSD